LTDVLHLKAVRVSPVECSAWSKTLGISEANPQPWTRVGEMIQADAGLVEKLCDALEIKKRPLHSGNYAKQTEMLAKELP
jgi:hypothetical protein